MAYSVFDFFSIGIGPSSSHTVGPMRAAKMFVELLKEKKLFDSSERIIVELFGSLAMTGEGHATDIALILGLKGISPEDVVPEEVSTQVSLVKDDNTLKLGGEKLIHFNYEKDLVFEKGKFLPKHSNAMRFHAHSHDHTVLQSQIYYSVGGGFVMPHEEITGENAISDETGKHVAFKSYQELKSLCVENNMTISEYMLMLEMKQRSEHDIRSGLLKIWKVMQDSVIAGIKTEGVLPGGLFVKRRAPDLYKQLLEPHDEMSQHLISLDWISLYALAVNEENAAGGKIVTAPTNGAAGVIPAVLHYYQKYLDGFSETKVVDFLLVAGAIAMIYKLGASLSAAEMGCQGEIGVASSMAAGALTACKGGSLDQIENAAEIAMEHHLGLTCDPIAGLVQIPCIERNTMGAIKAVNASRLAMRNTHGFKVTLDQVVKTMRQVGEDMNTKYKETSVGGLASNVSINIPEC